jgi:DNA processing protein
MEDILYQVGLTSVSGIGGNTARTLISYCGSAKNVFALPKGKLMKIPGIGEKTAQSLLDKTILPLAEKIIQRTEKDKVEILSYTSPQYPKLLKEIADAPIVLYYKGNHTLNHKKILAIVGTRNATDYGKQIVTQILEQIQHLQPIITSGLAYGIDIHTHKECLRLNIPTIGVMGSGIDIIYPALHKSTAEKMQNHGGILTEYIYGTKPDPMKFPARNRIVAGMSHGTLVIEAAKSGGALITAELANQYNREVLAVPGRVKDQYSEGCNQLIKDNKAHMVLNAQDVIQALNWDIETHTPLIKPITQVNERFQHLYNTIRSYEDITIDELSWRAEIPMNQLSSLLLEMEFDRLIQCLPGKKYRLI